jgi:iron complex outermembrane receptor protein
MKQKQLALAIGCLLGVTGAQAAESEEIPLILIEATPIAEPEGRTNVPAHSVQKAPAADSGSMLRSITGVSGVRMGGHGIDPVIRGQSQTRLNVLLDGAYLHGGCPNRMDPPTAYSPLHTYDSITVIKGSQTVRYGGGGSGGSILLERNRPIFAEGETFKGRAGYSYDSNPDAHSAYLDLAAGNNTAFIRGTANYGEGDDYEDGDGDEVRAAYEEKGASLTFGLTPGKNTLIQFSAEATREDDVLYAGAPMDAPESDADMYRLKFEHETDSGNAVRAELYHTAVDHLMDNYSLRPTAPATLLRTPTESDTWGGRFSGDIAISDATTWTIGVDYQDNDREATLNNDTAGTVMSHMWADAQLQQFGVFTELGTDLSASSRLDLGLRYDRVDAELGDPDAPGAQTPNFMFNMYYGTTADDADENNVGGFIRLKQELGDGPGYVYISASRTVRTADATERYMAKWVGNAAMRWIGNPDLDPEKHHQAEIGFVFQDTGTNFSASAYYNDVDDFILYDRAHGQSGILQADNAVIYRNIDAEFYGAELELSKRWNNWSAGFGLAYVHSKNDTDSRPIAQTPPLEGHISLDYDNGPFNAGGIVRAADKQTRVDDDMTTGSGLDADETAGWVTLDLHLGYEFGKHGEIELGVKNVFNEEYAQHLNKPNSFDPIATQINEPGRSFWAGVNLQF